MTSLFVLPVNLSWNLLLIWYLSVCYSSCCFTFPVLGFVLSWCLKSLSYPPLVSTSWEREKEIFFLGFFITVNNHCTSCCVFLFFVFFTPPYPATKFQTFSLSQSYTWKHLSISSASCSVQAKLFERCLNWSICFEFSFCFSSFHIWPPDNVPKVNSKCVILLFKKHYFLSKGAN